MRISGPDIGTKTALTDAQGRFEFKLLPAGRFNVSVSKSGYVTMAVRPERGRSSRDVRSSSPTAQTLDKADVALPRGSVLAGRVVDEFGEAVADADVTAMRLQFQNGRRRLVPSGRNASTNDLGQFRIYGLPPGEYYVIGDAAQRETRWCSTCSAAAARPAGPTGSNQNAGYAATYYPSTPNPGEAQRVALAVGQELASVDIQLQPVKLARITGTALGSDGKPMTRRDGDADAVDEGRACMFGPGGTSRTDKDGNFTLTGVTPGDYSLQVQSTGGDVPDDGRRQRDGALPSPRAPTARRPPARAGRRSARSESPRVSVSGDDITGVVVTGTRGAKATGTISFEGGAKPDGIANIRVTAPATDVDNNPMPTFGAGQVKDTGAFEVEGLIGGASSVRQPAPGLGPEAASRSTARTSPTAASSSSRATTSTASRSS